jgi:uncharacterized protein YcbX
MIAVHRINLTPVKGTALAHPDEVLLTTEGIAGNRRFHLADPEGRHFGVFEDASLIRVRSSLSADGTLRCTFPDGSEVTADQDALGEPTITRFDGHDVAGRVVLGPLGEAFSTYLGQEVRLIRADRDVDGNDVEPITLVSLASVDELAKGGPTPAEPLDPGRFRMNLEIEGAAPFEEDTWEGGDVAVGEAVLRILGTVPRCRVTNHHPVSGAKDFPTLATIAALRPRGKDLPFGMYAVVVRDGIARVGDAVIPRTAH